MSGSLKLRLTFSGWAQVKSEMANYDRLTLTKLPANIKYIHQSFWNFNTMFWHECLSSVKIWTRELSLDRFSDIWRPLYTHVPTFGSLSWFWRWKEHTCPWSPHLKIWRMLQVPDWGLASWSWFWYSHWSLIHSWSKFWLSILILKVQRTSMSFKSSFWAVDDAGGSWLGLGILILIWIWSLVFDTPLFQNLSLYLYFEDSKKIHVL